MAAFFKYAAVIVSLFLFSVVQTSFFPYLAILGAVPNLVFILFFVVIFFEQPGNRGLGIATAIMAGIATDMFFNWPFGISVAAFLAVYFLHALLNHFLREDQSHHLVVYFTGMFCGLFAAHQVLLYFAGQAVGVQLGLGLYMLVSMGYSLVFAVAGFYLARRLLSRNFDNQLKLL